MLVHRTARAYTLLIKQNVSRIAHLQRSKHTNLEQLLEQGDMTGKPLVVRLVRRQLRGTGPGKDLLQQGLHIVQGSKNP